MTLLRAPLPALIALLVSACGTTTTQRLNLPPVQTVESVDLERYVGSWYEIAAFPQRFQKDCTATTARYEPREDGEIDVTNSCRKGGLDGELDVSEGRARVVDEATNAKLEVSFFPLTWGDYWVIDLAPDYHWAVVGHPSRDYLWILSRTPALEEEVLEGIRSRLVDQQYPLDRLVMTLQPDDAPPFPPVEEDASDRTAPAANEDADRDSTTDDAPDWDTDTDAP